MLLLSMIGAFSILSFGEISCGGIVPSSNELHESTGKCALEIANKYFATDSPNINLFLINSSRDDELLSLVYHSRDHVKTLRDFRNFQVNFNDSKRRFVIVAAESLAEFTFYSYQFSKLNLWNARARYIFIIRNNSVESLNQAVNLLWYNYIINGLIMMPSKDNRTIQEIYSWFPYENGMCGENFTARVVDVCEYGRFRENLDLFPLKVPDIVNNCPVRARVVLWTPFVMPPDDGVIKDNVPLNITQGVEIMILKTAAQYMNINTIIMLSTKTDNWGIVTPDGNTTGNIRDLYLKLIDIALGGYGAMIERRMYCDFTVNVYTEGLTWCVPQARLAAKWHNLIDIFQYTTWLSIIGAYFLISFIVWCVCNFEPKDITSYVSFYYCLEYLFSIFLAISCTKTPKKTSGRVVYFVWVVFGIHFVAAYQAKLITVLMRPIYETQLNTLEGIVTSGIKWGAIPSLKRYFADIDDWRVRAILRDWESCTDVDACLDRIAYRRDFALLVLRDHANYEKLSYLDEHSRPMIYCYPKEYLMFPAEMYLTKGFPFRDRLDNMIRRIQQAGFISKWQRDYELNEIIKQKHIANEKNPQQNEQKLTLAHLQGAFLVLNFGLFTALLGFIGEHIIYKLKKKTNRKYNLQK